MAWLKKKKSTVAVPESCKDFAIEVDKSICTGEMTVGFRDPASGKLKFAELAKSEADIEAYKSKYGR
ncbi:MAG: hypothetical protein NC300_08290 [Bacteroidales bacterium]|nr:hypothetical protein [Clostridium sp.]MCM1204130.1 hypothetical protein [Bacteroidales bacterium]